MLVPAPDSHSVTTPPPSSITFTSDSKYATSPPVTGTSAEDGAVTAMVTVAVSDRLPSLTV